MEVSKKNKIKHILSIIGNVVLVLIFIFCISLLGLSISMKKNNQQMRLFGYEIRQVVSGSMEPSIKTGSLVFIDTTTIKTELKEGDIVTFNYKLSSSSTSEVVTHRIIKKEIVKNKTYYTLKGDAISDTSSVQKISSDDVIGLVTHDSFFLGCINRVFQSKVGIICCLIIPSCLIIIYETYKIVMVFVNDKKDKDKELIKENNLKEEKENN